MDEFLNNGTMTARTAQARTIDSNRISGDSFRFAALEPGMDDSQCMTHLNESLKISMSSHKKVHPVKIPFGVQFAINYFFGIHGILGLITQPAVLRRRELSKNFQFDFYQI